ncbi:hypothetical protein TrVE_jg6743 [Triparma verrucosa]|uniref:Uncharacterized protein n=1 Tax=Triparma verrucosa TaxID=1606542 RepID=A0A9W7EW82_9STRA|nr:hypothetical protein TrVE_jg6743 [Triparma verrucosa]
MTKACLGLLLAVWGGIAQGELLRSHPSRHTSSIAAGDETLPECVPLLVSQPLNHFGPSPGDFEQHLCVVDAYFDPTEAASVFFYVGNESPLEEYVNNTGLMYSMAPKFNSLLVFAEHRYMGASVPNTIGIPDCLGYDTIAQALADYASIMSFIASGGENKIPVSLDYDYDFSAFVGAPIITFGGSYGGMLSAYARYTYPSLVTGAIAASAPTWGLPLSNPPIDAGASFVGHGMGDQCKANFKSGLVIINEIMKLDDGAEYLSQLLGLCSPLESADGAASLLDFLQAPWFDLAEGNFPFPSSYIPFAVGPGNYELPPWPVRVACESLDMDFDVSVSGDVSDVKFTVSSGPVGVNVDWNVTQSSGFSTADVGSTKIPELLKGMVGAVNVWCNVTGEETCTSVGSCPTGRRILKEEALTREFAVDSKGSLDDDNICSVDISLDSSFNCWPAMTCNDDLNLENALAQGLGNDIYWPPSVPRGTTLESFLGEKGALVEGCPMDAGLYGLPKTADNWSTRLNMQLGGSSLEGYTNVVFSNGYLDPWASAGVMSGGWKPGDDAVIELGEGSVAIMIEEGAHHLDLMFPTDVDPVSVVEARQVEEDMIATWIETWRKK